jgi:hypothetical protein
VGFVVDTVALGQVFPEFFGFTLQFSFHLLLHTIGQIVVDAPSGVSLNLAQQITKKK